MQKKYYKHKIVQNKYKVIQIVIVTKTRFNKKLKRLNL